MAGLSKILFKVREIIYLDYRGLKETEIIEALKKAETLVLRENKPYLTLTNFDGAYATPGFLEQANKLREKTKHLAIKGAIVGIEGAKGVILSVFNSALKGSGIVTFQSEEEAKEYLIND
ncbi:MAG: hypothetical protein JXQ90_08170 [Cyclobacteriaceae bacterium]